MNKMICLDLDRLVGQTPSSWDHQARLCHRLRGHQVKI